MRTKYFLPFAVACFGRLACSATAPSVAVFFDFETEPSVESVSQMKAEVEAILEPSGLLLDWHSLRGRDNQAIFRDLVVLKFQGSCSVRNPAMDSELGPGFERSALATTAVSDGHILPFSSVNCNEIRRFLAPNLADATPPNRDAMYGKALGRVVAHELYHILASTGHHGTEGVARAQHSRQNLTERRFRFSAQETALLREYRWRALMAGEGENVSFH